jgi:DNA-binding CsgD family transcriptional regulator/tetratricopeptide (TPR) repeat protein
MSLLEREAELDTLSRTFASAAGGRGSVVLVSGEAGIGKTSLVRAAVSGLPSRARVLRGACDDLIAPRSFGPLRDAVRGVPGPLAAAVAAGADREAVFEAVFAELGGSACPVVLIVEDVHWADDATLDLLRLLGRRVVDLPAVVVLTFRDDEMADGHPLRRLLGALVGPHVCRLPLARLSAHAVHELADEVGVDGAAALAATAGNPFFLAEVLANPGAGVPPTVADAVLARVMQLDEATRSRVEQLAVVVAPATRSLVEALPGGTGGLVAAERLGIVEFDGRNVVFRHDLTRRAIEASLPGARRIALHRLVLALLLAQPEPDLPRVVHHAVEAGNAEVILRYGRQVAQQAAHSGANRQALAVREQMLRHADQMAPIELARLHIGHAWALFNAGRYAEGLAVAERGVTLWEKLDDPVGLSEALVTLGRQLLLTTRPRSAEPAARRALAVLDAEAPGYPQVLAGMFLGAVLVLTDQPAAALPYLEEALELALRQSDDMIALCRSYVGLALAGVGDPRAADELVQSLEPTATPLHHERRLRVLRNTADGMRRLGRWQDERLYVAAAIDESSRYDQVAPVLESQARHWALVADGGDWAAAEAGLRAVLERDELPAVDYMVLPVLGRLLVRTGRVDEGRRMIADAWALASEADILAALAPAAIALAEQAWLTGRDEGARAAAALVLQRTDPPGTAHYRGELLRYLRRLGEPVPASSDVPAEWRGAHGDWRAAAAEWEARGLPYERAVELIDSGEAETIVEGLLALDGLGAVSAAALARSRLRELGVARIPRGPRPQTRENVAGLTERQHEVVGFLAQGMTNAEIAQRLVVSVRTVDHHVTAILTKLGVGSRRDAIRRAAELDLI